MASRKVASVGLFDSTHELALSFFKEIFKWLCGITQHGIKCWDISRWCITLWGIKWCLRVSHKLASTIWFYSWFIVIFFNKIFKWLCGITQHGITCRNISRWCITLWGIKWRLMASRKVASAIWFNSWFIVILFNEIFRFWRKNQLNEKNEVIIDVSSFCCSNWLTILTKFIRIFFFNLFFASKELKDKTFDSTIILEIKHT